jgi:hypothetical protein
MKKNMKSVREKLTVTVSTDPFQNLESFESSINADINPAIYLAIDPGKANGVCGYDEKYYTKFMVTVQSVDMVRFLTLFKRIELCVTEGYKLYPNKTREQIYSDMETPRVIGRIESWAEQNKVKLEMQPASIKPTGYKWIGQKPLPKSNPLNHQLDAHVHFMHWGIKAGKIPIPNLAERLKK